MEEARFSFDENAFFAVNKCYFVPDANYALLSLLNAKLYWAQLRSRARIKQNGYIEAEIQYVSRLPIPDMTDDTRGRLAVLAQACTAAARARFAIQSAVRHRILDLAPPERRKLTGKLEAWHELDFTAFRDEVKKAFHVEIPLKQRGEWEIYLAENAAEVHRLSAEIAAAEREIDILVYRLFDLTADEIALLEASLEGQY